MTSRVSFFKLINNYIKRNVWVPAVLLLIAIISGPVLLLISADNASTFTTAKDFISYMEACLLPDMLVLGFVTIITSLLLAFTGFSFLFSKSQVDLFHSLPIKRGDIFKVQYISGSIIFAAVELIKVILIIAISAIGGYLTGTAVQNIAISTFGEIVLFFFFYNVNIIAIMLTGNIVTAILGAVTLNAVYPLYIYAFNYLADYAFVTKTYKSAIYGKIPFFSPFVTLLEYVKQITDYEMQMTKVVILLIVAAIFAGLSLCIAIFLYKERPSESCGKAIVFEISKPIIRIVLTILGGLIGITIVCSNVNKYMSPWIIVGLVLGSVICHVLLEVIYNADFKAAFKNCIQLAICILVTGAVLFIFKVDMFGYDKYIPNRNKIEKATVSIPSLDSNLSCLIIKDINDRNEVQIAYNNRDDYMKKLMFSDEEVIDLIYEFNKLGISFVDKMKEEKENPNGGARPYAEAAKEVIVGVDEDEPLALSLDDIEIREDVAASYNTNIYFSVYYKLKNGREVERQYNGPKEQMYEAINKLYENKVFKQTHFDLYAAKELNVINGIDVLDTFSEKRMSVLASDANEFLNIYLDDLLNITIDDVVKMPIASVVPKAKDQEGYIDNYNGYYIYPSFKNTIAYMEAHGVDMSRMITKPNMSDVESISVSAYDYVFNKNTDEPVYINNMMLSFDNPDDEAIIDIVKDKLSLFNLGWSNGDFINREQRVEFMIYYKVNGGIQVSSTAYLNKNDVPEELKNAILAYAVEHPNGEMDY